MPARGALGCGLLLGCLALSSTALGQGVNEFPVVSSTEIVRGESRLLTVAFRIYFPVDDQRYAPVGPELAALLSLAPRVQAGAGLGVRHVKTVCSPQDMAIYGRLGIFSARGGQVVSQIEITPSPTIEPGDLEVRLSYSMIDLVFRQLGAQLPSSKAEAVIKVRIWASQEARQEAAEEQRREQEARERQRALEAKESRHRLGKTIGSLVAVFALVVVAWRLVRRQIWPRVAATRTVQWIRPDVDVQVGIGGHVQRHKAVAALPKEATAEPGTILSTLWAEDRRGRRQRIKVEILATDDAPGDRSARRLDLLVSVGASVTPGTYLARGPNGSVRIAVPAATQ